MTKIKIQFTLIATCYIVSLLVCVNAQTPPTGEAKLAQVNDVKEKAEETVLKEDIIKEQDAIKTLNEVLKDHKESSQQKDEQKVEMENGKVVLKEEIKKNVDIPTKDQVVQSLSRLESIKTTLASQNIDKTIVKQVKDGISSQNAKNYTPQPVKTPTPQSVNIPIKQPAIKQSSTTIAKPQVPTMQALPILQQRQVQWPIQSQLYHIYSAMNPRLVLDVAKAEDGYHDLILYNWQNSLNQMYYFKRVTKNHYNIINAESGLSMKKSQKQTKEKVPKVKFSKQKDQLWQLIPAKKNSINSFYIRSTSEDIALDLNLGYADVGAEIILYQFHQHDNQVWFLRKNKPKIDPTEQSEHNEHREVVKKKYEEKVAELLYKVMSIPDSINECITLQEIKKEMSEKNISRPHWLKRPDLPKIEQQQLPQEILFRKPIKSNNHTKPVSLKKEEQSVSEQNQQKESTSTISTQNPPITFIPSKLSLQCAKRHTIAYIWYSNKAMPRQYQQLLKKCKQNIRLLTQTDFDTYVAQWNAQNPGYQIDIEDYIIRQRVNLLKLLYLYFESGIYADFDTQINEQCFDGIYTDEIIWTSPLDENIRDSIIFPLEEIVVPEESFMMISSKQHPQVKRMLQEEIMEHNNRGGERWKECKYRQCLIVHCQRHYRDNTYKKGFD